MEAVNLKLEKGLLKKIDEAVKKNDYSTRTEFIRESVRKKLTDLEKEEAIRKLTAFKGSLKGKAKMGYEEARELAAKETAKKFGIRLD